MTLEQAIFTIAARSGWTWTAAWWRLGCIIVNASGRSWEARSPQDTCPKDVAALGCSGTDCLGRLAWVGWDLDVGHGKAPYRQTEEAIADARRLRQKLDGRAEIRRSKSGLGIHVRHMLGDPQETGLQGKDGKAKALELTTGVWIKLDATPLGRQAFWLWARKPGERGFEIVEEHRWE